MVSLSLSLSLSISLFLFLYIGRVHPSRSSCGHGSCSRHAAPIRSSWFFSRLRVAAVVVARLGPPWACRLLPVMYLDAMPFESGLLDGRKAKNTKNGMVPTTGLKQKHEHCFQIALAKMWNTSPNESLHPPLSLSHCISTSWNSTWPSSWWIVGSFHLVSPQIRHQTWLLGSPGLPAEDIVYILFIISTMPLAGVAALQHCSRCFFKSSEVEWLPGESKKVVLRRGFCRKMNQNDITTSRKKEHDDKLQGLRVYHGPHLWPPVPQSQFQPVPQDSGWLELLWLLQLLILMVILFFVCFFWFSHNCY